MVVGGTRSRSLLHGFTPYTTTPLQFPASNQCNLSYTKFVNKSTLNFPPRMLSTFTYLHCNLSHDSMLFLMERGHVHFGVHYLEYRALQWAQALTTQRSFNFRYDQKQCQVTFILYFAQHCFWKLMHCDSLAAVLMLLCILPDTTCGTSPANITREIIIIIVLLLFLPTLA